MLFALGFSSCSLVLFACYFRFFVGRLQEGFFDLFDMFLQQFSINTARIVTHGDLVPKFLTSVLVGRVVLSGGFDQFSIRNFMEKSPKSPGKPQKIILKLQKTTLQSTLDNVMHMRLHRRNCTRGRSAPDPPEIFAEDLRKKSC